MSNILLFSEVFGRLFLLGNALDRAASRHLSGSGASLVQWQLCAALSKRPGQAANLSTLAAQLSTSRQNVKQVALGLEKRGWIRMESDPADARSLLLSLQPACAAFWQAREEQDCRFLEELFAGIGEKPLAEALGTLTRIHAALEGSEEGKS